LWNGQRPVASPRPLRIRRTRRPTTVSDRHRAQSQNLRGKAIRQPKAGIGQFSGSARRDIACWDKRAACGVAARRAGLAQLLL
jgi:hypothetical protein